MADEKKVSDEELDEFKNEENPEHKPLNIQDSLSIKNPWSVIDNKTNKKIDNSSSSELKSDLIEKDINNPKSPQKSILLSHNEKSPTSNHQKTHQEPNKLDEENKTNQNVSIDLPPKQVTLQDICKKYQNEDLFKDIYPILLKLWNEPGRDRALGCIAGAFIGDSIGSYLEFNNQPKKEVVNAAMFMPGGGTFNLVPGQVTDDSEIALCLANGLILGEGTLNLDHIAAQYRDWMQSFPFDIGSTIGSAFFPLYEVKKQVGEFPFSKAITKSAFKNNQLSESNGCLMRITPLAIWCRNLSEKDIKKAVKAEIRHTHPSKIVLKACFYWVLAIVKLMNLVDKPDKTEEENIKLRMETVYEEIKSKIQFEKEMDDWWKLVEENKYISANDRMGWMKIAWTYGFIFLKQRQIDYYEIIKDVISRGGDTDTNACIVGGMIGSAIGFKRIPLQYLEKMILCNSTIGCKPRKPFFNPRNGLILGDEIYEMAPKNLLIKSEDL